MFCVTDPNVVKDSWDVVNGRRHVARVCIVLLADKQPLAPAEPFNEDGTWRDSVFYRTLNTTFVSIALKAARAADPNAKLYVNDYNIESAGAKSTAMQNLVKSLKSSNVPVDGVGLQCHFIVGEVPTAMNTIMSQFTALGLEVAVTELDIRMTLPSTSALLNQQKSDYESVVKQCMSVKGCVGITVWDWTDKVLVSF